MRAINAGVIAASLFMAQTSLAGWSLNIGYHNPPGALAGLNFLYYSNPWAFEVGLGWMELKAKDTDNTADSDATNNEDKDKDSLSLRLGGGLNLKYFIAAGSIKPYLQGGFGAAVGGQAGKESGASASVGGPYAGVGLLFGGNPLYAYLSFNIASSTFVQAGLGFDL